VRPDAHSAREVPAAGDARPRVRRWAVREDRGGGRKGQQEREAVAVAVAAVELPNSFIMPSSRVLNRQRFPPTSRSLMKYASPPAPARRARHFLPAEPRLLISSLTSGFPLIPATPSARHPPRPFSYSTKHHGTLDALFKVKTLRK
jgi:hypothetical protein